LLHGPKCDPADEPIELSGPWLGIHDRDRTEVDLIPPYQLDMFVEDASVPQYDRAYLTIEVTPSLGMPLDHQDVAGSLWQGGTIAIAVSCDGDLYVAQGVKAFPPSG